MFLHLFKYKLKMLFKPSEELFWTYLFPLILATMFFVAFGNIAEKTENFSTIPVAVVKEAEPNEYLNALLTQLSSDSDDATLKITETSKDEAQKMLQDDKIDAIVTINEDISLTVSGEGINQSIVRMIFDQYKQISDTITNVASTNPEKVPEVLATMYSTIQANIETTLNEHDNLDTMTWYFFALVSMNCLFGCLFGLRSIVAIQANITVLAARRCVTPTHKLKLIVSDMLACIIVQYLSNVVLLCYLIFGLHINFGDRLPYVFLTALVGSLVGVANGTFVGAIGRFSEGVKDAIIMGGSMIFCFLGGLMVGNMKDMIDKTLPFINKINPAALIADSFYSLSIYDNLDRYMLNTAILVVMTVVLAILSFCLVRRERYASI